MRPTRNVSMPRCAVQTCALVAVLISSAAFAHRVRADADSQDDVPKTFSYTRPAADNRVRAFLELTGVYTVGFMYYLSTNHLLPGFDVGYSWPVFREKLLGQGLEYDINGLNTNFVGHPAGGTMYYTMARSNHLSIAESEAFAIGGSLLWELFGEVREFISINDMIVTPLAGVAIGEPLLQLGAFFDRSSPALRNRILGAIFAPVKTLNDALDGRTLARSQQLDDYGFAANEFHRFDLNLGSAAAMQSPSGQPASGNRTFEYRLSLASYLVRLPGYDGGGQRSKGFRDGNVTRMRIDAAVTSAGLVDLEFHSLVGFAGYHYRSARRRPDGTVVGHGSLLAVTMGYQYVLHDYDRDRKRLRPVDRVTSVQPLGLLLEERVSGGGLRWVMHLEGGLDFGGARPYALMAYLKQADIPPLPQLIGDNRYYFTRGAHVHAATTLTARLFELGARFQYEAYSQLDVPIAIDDNRMLLEGRLTLALGRSPGRLGVVVRRRSRRGHMGESRASRSETSVGLELGARY